MSLHAAGRANQRPMVPAFPNLTATTIAILPTVIPDTHRAFDLRPNGSARVFALLASEKRVTADRLGCVARVRFDVTRLADLTLVPPLRFRRQDIWLEDRSDERVFL